ncbi:MAG: DUF2165 family protein [Sporichthyaceae bacterium]
MTTVAVDQRAGKARRWRAALRPTAEPESGSRTGLLQLTVFALAGMAVWFSVVVLNNATDFRTNRGLVEATITMKAVIAEPGKGDGLEWRAMPGDLAGPLFGAIVGYQVLIVASLWRAVGTGVRAVRGRADRALFVRRTNAALMLFLGLFFFFLAGGLWFAYWLALGPVQQVHLTLLIVGFLLAVLVNGVSPARQDT